jgi:hypothetical protein
MILGIEKKPIDTVQQQKKNKNKNKNRKSNDGRLRMHQCKAREIYIFQFPEKHPTSRGINSKERRH